MKDILMMQIEFVDIKTWGLPDEPGNYLVAWDDGTVETYPIDDDDLDKKELSFENRDRGRYLGTVWATHWAEVEHPDIALAERAKTLAATDTLKGVRLT